MKVGIVPPHTKPVIIVVDVLNVTEFEIYTALPMTDNLIRPCHDIMSNHWGKICDITRNKTLLDVISMKKVHVSNARGGILRYNFKTEYKWML